MSKDPIYKYSGAYAREHNELPQFQQSRKALADCKAAIDAAISDKWDGWHFPQDAAKAALEQFGPERVAYVLANTVRQSAEDDTRFSQHNRDWAHTISLYVPAEHLSRFILESHPAKIDQFIDLARKDIAELAQQKTPAQRKRPAKHGKETIKMDNTPIYKFSFQYAYEHGEAEQCLASKRSNIACKEAIENAIANHYGDNRFNAKEAVQEVVKQFGYERTFYVLANTVQTMDTDGRISRANKDWARSIPVAFQHNGRDTSFLITRSHPGLLNMFVETARHEHLLKQPLKAADIKAEATHILKRLQDEQEPNSPNGTHYMAQVSPVFMARAKSKDTDRLMAMLPFQSLSLSTLEDRKGIYALISKDENRFQKLVLRRPSVRKKLQEKSEISAATKSPGKNKSKGQEL